MSMPSDATVLAASFTLGCVLIHVFRREAAVLTALLTGILIAVSLVLIVLLADRWSGERVGIAEFSETSERIYGFD